MKRRAWFWLLLFVFALTLPGSIFAAGTPQRTILLIIDGLHWEAPERLGLSHFLDLEKEGARVRKAYLLAPYHPTTGRWAEYYTSSMPNPILLSGTLFLRPGQRLIQDVFFPTEHTAHATNSTSYTSIDPGNTLTYQAAGDDASAIDWAQTFLQNGNLRFLRIHLQDTGDAGYESSIVEDPVSWRRNIWASESPYVRTARKADQLLGELVAFLKASSLWEDTLLIVTSDHGQVSEGWHPALAEDSWVTPLVMVGPGIRKGVQLEYAEHIDIVPTICHLMQVAAPAEGPGAGRVMREVLLGVPSSDAHPRWTLRINELLREYALLRSELTLLSSDDSSLETLLLLQERRFYGLDRFLEWPEAGDLQSLCRQNQEVVEVLRQALQKAKGQNR